MGGNKRNKPLEKVGIYEDSIQSVTGKLCKGIKVPSLDDKSINTFKKYRK